MGEDREISILDPNTAFCEGCQGQLRLAVNGFCTHCKSPLDTRQPNMSVLPELSNQGK